MGAVSTGAVVDALSAQLAAFQALLLAMAAAHKLLRWPYSQRIVRQFASLRRSLAASALGAAVAAELAAAALLLVPTYRAMGALLAAALWSIYLALIVRAVAEGRRDVDCGCGFGSAVHVPGWYQIARNALLSGLALLVASVSATGGAVVQGSQVLAAFALMALYGALDQVMASRPLRSGEIA